MLKEYFEWAKKVVIDSQDKDILDSVALMIYSDGSGSIALLQEHYNPSSGFSISQKDELFEFNDIDELAMIIVAIMESNNE